MAEPPIPQGGVIGAWFAAFWLAIETVRWFVQHVRASRREARIDVREEKRVHDEEAETLNSLALKMVEELREQLNDQADRNEREQRRVDAVISKLRDDHRSCEQENRKLTDSNRQLAYQVEELTARVRVLELHENGGTA